MATLCFRQQKSPRVSRGLLDCDVFGVYRLVLAPRDGANKNQDDDDKSQVHDGQAGNTEATDREVGGLRARSELTSVHDGCGLLTSSTGVSTLNVKKLV